MTQESTVENSSLTELEDLTTQEVAAIVLPVLVAGEAVIDTDLELIKKRAAMLLTADAALSLEDALFRATDERFSARKGLVGDSVAVVNEQDSMVYALGEDQSKAIGDALHQSGRE